MRRLLLLISIFGLAACATSDARLHVGAGQSPHLQPADGLWAILDPDCPKPTLANVGAWPKCASPFWIDRGSAIVVHTNAAAGGRALSHSYRANFLLAGADPLLAQVGNDKDGYLFLALTKLTHDERGRLIAAVGAAVACPPGLGDGPMSATPNAGGCEAASTGDVRRAARASLRDGGALTRVAWIAAGAPSP